MARGIAAVVGMAVALLGAGPGCAPSAEPTTAAQGLDKARPKSLVNNLGETRLIQPLVRLADLRSPVPRTPPGPPDPEECVVSGIPSAMVRSGSAPGVAFPGSAAPRYLIDETAEIYLAALLRNLCGTHVAIFDLYAPDGSFYTRLTAAFDAARAPAVDGGRIVEVRIPVADTEMSLLPGTWSVNFLLDDQSLALGLGLFELYE
jgi:hypothetical protein